MKFESEKGLFFGIVILGTALTLILVFFSGIMRYGSIPLYIMQIINVIIIIFLLWLWFNTNYTIKNSRLTYVSGPLRGKINIRDIKKIIKNKTLWSGTKPALATNGLIIKYNRYDEVYISPKNKEDFIKELLKINSDIEVIG